MTTYAADTFTRADGAVGNTETGGFPWTGYGVGSATSGLTNMPWAIASNRLSVVASADGILVADDGQSDGVLSMTYFAGGAGLTFRAINGTQFWIVWTDSTHLRLMRYNSGYTQVAAAATETTVSGDVITVTLAGSSITVAKNGTQVITATDATFSTATKHGVRAAFSTVTLDNYSHASAAGGATVPGQVTGLTATPGNGQVALSWTAPADGGAAITDYAVEFQTTAGSGWSTFADGTSTTPAATVTGLTNGTSYDFRVSAVNSVGTGAASATTSATPAAGSGTIAPNDANIVYSPYTWDVAASTAVTTCTGAYLRAVLAGNPTSIVANFDVTGLTGANQLAIKVDNEPVTTATLAATVTIPIPTNIWGKHTVEIVATRLQGGDKWTTPTNRVKFTGFTVTPGTVATATNRRAPRNVLCYGDSILEGYSTYAANINDGRLGWGYPLRALLGAEVGVVGFNAQGFTQAGEANVPVFGSAYNLLWTGKSRSFTTPAEPDLILINMGTNDGTTSITTAATAVLNGLLAATTTAKIAVVQQWKNTNQKANWQAAVAACSAPSRVTYVDTTGWLSNADTSDTTHPYGYAHTTDLSPRLAAAVLPLIAGGSVTPKRFLNKAGVATPIA